MKVVCPAAAQLHVEKIVAVDGDCSMLPRELEWRTPLGPVLTMVFEIGVASRDSLSTGFCIAIAPLVLVTFATETLMRISVCRHV
jgi:hypothetical protein